MLEFTGGRPVDAIRMAANLGGDCDTTASIVGGMCGAISGIGAFPAEWIETVESVNGLGLERYASELARLLERPG